LKVNVAVVVAASKFESAALVTVSVQVPADVELRVDPLNEHPVAVPSATDVIESVPVPEPPVTEVTESEVWEYG
jgi:hypothetical protein